MRIFFPFLATVITVLVLSPLFPPIVIPNEKAYHRLLVVSDTVRITNLTSMMASVRRSKSPLIRTSSLV